MDTPLQVSARDARGTCQWGFNIKFADLEDGFGVVARMFAKREDGFIAGAFAFCDEPSADPPDDRMEPEDGFDEHVKGGREIVAAANVSEFVGEDGFELRGSEGFEDAFGEKQRWAEDADDAGFEEAGCGANFDRNRNIDRRAGAKSSADVTPGAETHYADREKAAAPHGDEREKKPVRRMLLDRGEGKCFGNGLRDLDDGLGDRGTGHCRRGISCRKQLREICAESDQQRERNEELQRSSEPERVANVSAIFAKGQSEQRSGQSEDRRLPKVICECAEHRDLLRLISQPCSATVQVRVAAAFWAGVFCLNNLITRSHLDLSFRCDFARSSISSIVFSSSRMSSRVSFPASASWAIMGCARPPKKLRISSSRRWRAISRGIVGSKMWALLILRARRTAFLVSSR